MNSTDNVTAEEVAQEMRAAMRRIADEEITLLIRNRLIPWEHRIEKLEREVNKLRRER